MSWSQFWLFFIKQTNEMKRDLWRQIELIDLLLSVPLEERQIVLENAPEDIIRYAQAEFTKQVQMRRSK